MDDGCEVVPIGGDVVTDVARVNEAHDKPLVLDEVYEDIDGGTDCCQETGQIAHTF